MNSPDSFDGNSKRLLAALACAMVIAVIILTRSFIALLAPPEPGITDSQKATTPVVKANTEFPSAWYAQAQDSSTAPKHITSVKRDEFDPPKNDAEIRQAMVHRQADDLRKMVKQNKLPASLGHLTLEQIDEMEKNGIVIQ